MYKVLHEDVVLHLQNKTKDVISFVNPTKKMARASHRGHAKNAQLPHTCLACVVNTRLHAYSFLGRLPIP